MLSGDSRERERERIHEGEKNEMHQLTAGCHA